MPPAQYMLVVDMPEVRATLTRRDLKEVNSHYEYKRGHNLTPFEELVMDITRHIRKPLRKLKRYSKEMEDVAVLIKVLRETRSIAEARAFVKSDEGRQWLDKWIFPKTPNVPTRALIDAAPARDLLDVAPARGPREALATVGAEPDRTVTLDGQVEDPFPQWTSRAFSTSLEGPGVMPGVMGNVQLGASTEFTPLLLGSLLHNPAHSRTPSDVDPNSLLEPCPNCHQYHTVAIPSSVFRLRLGQEHGHENVLLINVPLPEGRAVPEGLGRRRFVVEHRPLKVWLVVLSVLFLVMSICLWLTYYRTGR